MNKYWYLLFNYETARTCFMAYAKIKLLQSIVLLCLSFCVLLLPNKLLAQNELINLDLDQLTKIKVTSVAKTDQNALDAPAAVTVLTAADIRHAGVTNIPDALRLVPGMQVSQFGSNQWAINARGPQSIFANKLLVLIDGRSVYTQSFGGVNWDAQDSMLEDIERIEVIRGPGASIWGANAVNGVINIITKNSKNTQGSLFVVGGGSEERSLLRARQGGTFGENSTYRIWGTRSQIDSFNIENAGDARDGWEKASIGMRTDSNYSDGSKLTVLGGAFKSNSSEYSALPLMDPPYGRIFNDQTSTFNSHLQVVYEGSVSDDTTFSSQWYLDHTSRERTIIYDERDTLDGELSFQSKWNADNVLTYGTHYRLYTDDFHSDAFTVTPRHSNSSLVDAFIQNDTPFFDNKGHFIVGSKVEYNDFTGVEVQPTIRLSYKPASNQTAWSAFSRSVHTPTRLSDGIDVYSSVIYRPDTAPYPIIPRALGNKGLSAEEMFSYEVGYRFEPTKHASIDLSLFYNNYRQLVGSNDFDLRFAPEHQAYIVSTQFDNGGKARAYGAEVASRFHISDTSEISLGYTFLDYHSDFPTGLDRFIDTQNNAASRHRFFARSTWELSPAITLDTILREASSMSYYATDAYLQLDQQVSWRVRESVTVSLIGRNLLDQGQVEIGPEFYSVGRHEVPRSVFAKMEVRF
jgi:iron complex outermembrane receptor protein